MARWHRWVLMVGLGALPLGCGPAAPDRVTIRVAAASDLQAAMPILAAAWRDQAQVEVVPTFGASGQLAEQIRQGAPFDLFLSANRSFVDKLAAEGVVDPKSVQPYARGVLVLAVNKLSGLKLSSIQDLTKPEVHKIAIANPEVAPYGLAAKQAMEQAKLWDVLKPKLVPAESVRQALQFVQSGNAEVGFVGQSIAEVREVVVVRLPLDASEPIIQVLGVVARSPQSAEAERFADFLRSDVGQGILRDLGFRRVTEPTESEPPPVAD